jgi:5-methylcytosine-specific restriction endonuclease McrA
MASQHYTCERCGRLAVICHHKTYLTPQNWRDPNVALNWDNLEALCMDCHNQEHFKRYGVTREGLTFNERGELVKDGKIDTPHRRKDERSFPERR